ncbi:hypothetical protein V1504DRAFT_479163 [Lipomyces starkeyi]
MSEQAKTGIKKRAPGEQVLHAILRRFTRSMATPTQEKSYYSCSASQKLSRPNFRQQQPQPPPCPSSIPAPSVQSPSSSSSSVRYTPMNLDAVQFRNWNLTRAERIVDVSKVSVSTLAIQVTSRTAAPPRRTSVRPVLPSPRILLKSPLHLRVTPPLSCTLCSRETGTLGSRRQTSRAKAPMAQTATSSSANDPRLVLSSTVRADLDIEFQARAFLDSGSAPNLIGAELVRNHHSPNRQKEQPLVAKVVDGREFESGLTAQEVEVTLIYPKRISDAFDQCLLADNEMAKWRRVMANTRYDALAKEEKLCELFEDGFEALPLLDPDDTDAEEVEEVEEEGNEEDTTPNTNEGIIASNALVEQATTAEQQELQQR